MFNILSTQTKAYENLNGREFKDAYRKTSHAVLLDVRTSGEFSYGTITGAKNLDIMSPHFSDAIRRLDKDKEYFVFCRSGSRSAHACAIMAKEGLKAYNLAGGIGTWPR